MLKKEFDYFLEHQEELVKKHKGKYLVIKDQAIIGVFEKEIEAYEEISKKHELGTFLIQHCLSGKDTFTQVFHTRRAIFTE